MEPTERLSCRDISLGYERQSVLTHLSLTIRAGDYLCIVEAENDTYDIPQTVSYTVSAEDGGTFSISYARKQYNLTYNLNAEDATRVSEPGVKSYRLGAALKLLTQLQASHFDVKITACWGNPQSPMPPAGRNFSAALPGSEHIKPGSVKLPNPVRPILSNLTYQIISRTARISVTTHESAASPTSTKKIPSARAI